jgi:integrase
MNENIVPLPAPTKAKVARPARSEFEQKKFRLVDGATTQYCYFDHEGKTYTLEKRKQSRKGAWYAAFAIYGKRFHQTLETNVAEVAVERAIAGLIKPAKAERWGEVVPPTRQPATATFADVFKVWATAPIDIGERHRRDVPHAMRRVLRAAGCAEAGAEDGLAVRAFGAEAVARYFDAGLRRAQVSAEQGEAQRVKFSANRTLEQALCLFRGPVLARYRAADLVLPDMEPVFAAAKESRFRKVGRPAYNAPGDDVVKKTLDAWLKLERNEFVAVGLMLAFGLRCSEVAQARWEWLTLIQRAPAIDGVAAVKNRSGRVQVRALDPFYSRLMERVRAEQWNGAGGFVIEGTEPYRERQVFEDISAWMRGLGWQTQKTNHAFRDYAGSQVAMRYGIHAAQMWLRHSTVKVTEEHYTDFLEHHKVGSPEQVGVQWASAEQAHSNKKPKRNQRKKDDRPKNEQRDK